MSTLSDDIIDALGGSTAVARMIEAPLSTVHSWRRIGIPASRLAHLRLAAKEHGHAIDLLDKVAVAEAATARRQPTIAKQEAA